MWKVKELKIINEIYEKYEDEKLEDFISTTKIDLIKKEENKWHPVKYASIIRELESFVYFKKLLSSTYAKICRDCINNPYPNNDGKFQCWTMDQ